MLWQLVLTLYIGPVPLDIILEKECTCQAGVIRYIIRGHDLEEQEGEPGLLFFGANLDLSCA